MVPEGKWTGGTVLVMSVYSLARESVKVLHKARTLTGESLGTRTDLGHPHLKTGRGIV